MKNFLHNGRQALLVTIVLLLICGLLFPLLLPLFLLHFQVPLFLSAVMNRHKL